jgi:hypothetical protein
VSMVGSFSNLAVMAVFAAVGEVCKEPYRPQRT